jgi:hypothetical protein
VIIACAFEPQRVVVDPDVTVLMLERQKAEVKLKSDGGKLAVRCRARASPRSAAERRAAAAVVR